MKQKETLQNTMENKNIKIETIGEDHIGFSLETPLRDDAFMSPKRVENPLCFLLKDILKLILLSKLNKH